MDQNEIKQLPAAIQAAIEKIKQRDGARIKAAPVTLRGIKAHKISWIEPAICDCCTVSMEEAIFIDQPKTLGDCLEPEKQEDPADDVYNYWD